MPSQEASFDLPLATSLCSSVYLSFFAPNPPGKWRAYERSLTDTYTIYIDKDFVNNVAKGILEVKVFCALGLEPPCHKRHAEASFLYVSVSLGKNKATTKKISQAVRPDWDETLILYVRDPAKENLKIQVHQDAPGSGYFHRSPKLGAAELPIKDLCDGKAHAKDVSIKDTSSDRVCKVYFQVQFKKMADCVKSLVLDDIYLMIQEPCCEKGPAKWLRGPPYKLNELVSEKLGQDAKKANRKKDVKPGSKEDKGANSWKEVLELTGYKVKGSLCPVAFLDNQFTDTQVWLFRNTEARQVVVSFRSTQVQKEWLTSNKFTKVEWCPDWPDVAKPPAVTIHKGFLDAYRSMREELLALVDKLTEPIVEVIQDKHCTCKKEEKWTLYITGSCLGGALAMLCAYDIGVRERTKARLHHFAMYSFGAPRVGDSTFSQRYHKYVYDSWRIYRADDMFAFLPPAGWGGFYHHAPNSVLLNQDGLYETCRTPGNNEATDWVSSMKVMPIAAKDFAMAGHFQSMYTSLLYKSAHQLEVAKQAAEKKKQEEKYMNRVAALEPYKLLSPSSWYASGWHAPS